MRLILVATFALPLLALDNHITLRDVEGNDHGTRQFVIPRYFAENEICSNPRPYIGGSAVTYWQSHVETRWPASAICSGGSAKFAIIVIEAALGASAAVDVHFRNSTNTCHLGDSSTCTAAGASKADLLDFDAGGGASSWGARIQATTGGITLSRSARTMISADHYQIIRNGPIYAEVLVREGPDAVSAASTRTTNFGWKCTSGCTGPYTSATWTDDSTYYSIRPSFWLRFYRRWQKVEVDFVAHSGWMDRFADQRIESWELFTGGGEADVAEAGTLPFILSPRQTWWERTVWNGGAPFRSNIDFNVGYLVASRVIPPLNLSNLPTAAAVALEVAAFNATDLGETTNATRTPGLGRGQLNPVMSVAGANPYVGLFPRWTAKYLAMQHADLFDVMMGNARALMHFPFWYLESATSGEWATGTGASPFGRVPSLDLRPTLVTWYYNAATVTESTLGADRVTSPGGVVVTPSCSTCYVASSGQLLPWVSSTSASWNPFFVDRAHQVADFFIPYLATGKPLFREALQAEAAYNVGAATPAAGPYADGRQYERGLMDAQGNFPRGLYWSLRTLGHAAVMSPDGSPEKSYLTRMLDNNIALAEGKVGLTDGAFPPASSTAPYGCPSATQSDYWAKPSSYASIWCHGRYGINQGLANPMGWPGLASRYLNTPSVAYSVDLRYASEMISHWMMTYGVVTYGHLRDLGVTNIARVQVESARTWMKLSADSGAGRDYSILGMYYIPQMNATDTAFLATPAEVKAGAVRDARLAKPVTSSDTLFYSTHFCTSTYCPGVEPLRSASGPVRVGSEEFVLTDQTFPRNYYWRGAITAATDRLAFTAGYCFGGGCVPFDATGVHFLNDGDMLTVSNGPTITPTDLPIAADADNCRLYSRKGYCSWYVKVIDTRTVELYTDAALTQKVDFTADTAAASVYAGIVQWTVMTTNVGRCGGVSCRGVRGTTATSHAAGEAMYQVPVWSRQSEMTDVDNGYPASFRAAMAYAAGYGATITDSVTGKQITGSRAYELISAMTPYQDRHGDRGTCSGLDVTTCGNPRWGWIPWTQVAPTNVRATGGTGSATLRWVAPDGGACRYAVAGAFDNPDDSGDTSDGGGHRSRSATVTSLSAGSYVYRISCGSGRSSGTITVN